MDKKFVRVLCDVHCDWEGLPPVYRVYVNDELFTERTWIWNDVYLEELIQINAEPGKYQIRHELVPPHLAALRVENMRVELGDANIKGENLLRIYNENS
jgi:hypothetical protein